jgi:GNAT superfamily N-acetyltransferase
MAHGEVYAAEFGWDESFEALVARIVADYASAVDQTRQAAWIAELDGRRVGCVFCVRGEAEASAKLRILLVHPDGRGHGFGGRLVDAAIEFAWEAGYKGMQLWTNHPLATARRIYLARGFALIGEQPHRSFGVDLVGQTYALELAQASGSRAPAPGEKSRP